MYNKSLDTFLAVVKEGSFLKASENLFISHTAVIKQINSLEQMLGVRLFLRSNQGISLTEAGELLLQKAPMLIESSRELADAVQKAAAKDQKTVRVASSALYPCHSFMDLWDELQLPFNLQVVELKDDREFIARLNKDFDFVVGPTGRYENKRYGHLILGEYRFCLAVPRQHPLARSKTLSFSALSGQKLMIMHPGASSVNDSIRRHVETNHPDIEIVGIRPAYDLSTFEECVSTGIILLSLECWNKVHPRLKSIPLEEDYRMPYGINYATEHSASAEEFLQLLKDKLG